MDQNFDYGQPQAASSHLRPYFYHNIDFRNDFGKFWEGDFLSIFDGDSNISPILDTYCVDSLPPSQISSSNHLFFHFQSDFIETGTGFKLEYNALSKNTYKVGLIQSIMC